MKTQKIWIPENQYRKQKNKLKKQKINVVFNYSHIKLTAAMQSVLNRGFKFAVLPLKLDIAQVLTDFRRFERTMLWKEFWFGREPNEPYIPPMFKKRKQNFPRNHTAPRGLRDCLAAVRSEIADPKNRRKVANNISDDEKEALHQLIKLQKERKIVIKPCDKGAGIIILNFEEYLRAALDHLEATTATGERYYKSVNDSVLKEAKKKITTLVQEAHDNEIISKDEYSAMLPPEADMPVPGRFYCTFKVHKEHEHGKAPPPRGIVSCSGTLTENIALFVEHHIKEAGKSHETFLEDTPHFLRLIEEVNAGEDLPNNAMLVVIDVIGLYDNIPPSEGVKCVEESLNENMTSTVPPQFITRLMQVILEYSVFEFDGKKYQQQFGTSMGSKPAPPYANIFMARKVDSKIKEIARKYMENGNIAIRFLKRFLDDIFLIFFGSLMKLHEFFLEINKIHPTIKFTMSHTTPISEQQDPSCPCTPRDSIPYLDTSCTIKQGKIVTDLYRKPTDQNQYLLTSSCHPIECLDSIPFSLSLRINRVCMEEDTRDMRFQELKEMLLDRDYTPGIINAAISKARAIPRHVALRRVPRQDINSRPVFVVRYDPRLPSIPNITSRHWRSMVSENNYLKEVFPEPPLVSYKRQTNIRETLVRAKVAPARQQRVVNGMKKCNSCLACSYIKEGNTIVGKSYSGQKFKWRIGRPLSCDSLNVIYILECDKDNCKQRYIGMTENFRERIYQHVGYVRNKNMTRATGEHFNLPGHAMKNMKFSILEQVKSQDPLYAREREKVFIRKFNSFHAGINKEP